MAKIFALAYSELVVLAFREPGNQIFAVYKPRDFEPEWVMVDAKAKAVIEFFLSDERLEHFREC